ncbi:response regulator [Desulfonatronum lacustre]|uniref:response regulator n=1 Tax=Desulfonatronum lacustre TaxID=66849 RepID=UPI0004BCB42C|nr:response regulator [Desulfonatronum lacustre]SMP66087.1 Response regulator receiver domain-containing protein [Desulfonatronum zhilinae]
MKRTNVLVVDDQEDFRVPLVKRLQKRNFTVRGVQKGWAALEMMAEDPADVVLLDLRLQDMDGLDMLQMLKQSHPATQVVVLTGYASLESAQTAQRLGALDYLMKPGNLDEILSKINEAVLSDARSDFSQA